ncbi:CHAT domain-containing protein [Streptomyces aurantiacus]|uniref:CHAT domain-containing protein n=1 Tax=Streptomyces aurantiacus TaxID=47760 RepID=UPI0027D7C9AA|nr:CHAT domain-containing protein [Streptomyces aurantiacus]
MADDERLTALFAAAHDRVQAVMNGGDGEVVLGADAMDEAAELHAAMGRSSSAFYYTGLLAWLRFAARRDPRDILDLMLALRVFAVWFEHDPEHVPSRIQSVLRVEVPESVEPAVEGAPVHPYQLNAVAIDLLTSGPPELAVVSVALSRAAILIALPDGELIPALFQNLGAALVSLGLATDDPEILEEAVAVQRAAVDRVSKDGYLTPMCLACLALALGYLHEHSRDRRHLGEALAAMERALELTRHDDPELPDRLSDHAQLLLSKHACSGELEDAHQAHSSIGLALALTTADHPRRAVYEEVGRVTGLAVVAHFSMKEEPGRSPTMATVNEALEEIATLRGELAELADGDPLERAVTTSVLALKHERRWSRMGTLEDLEEAIRHYHAALNQLPEDHGRYAESTQGLIFCLMARYRLFAAIEDLEEVVALERRLVTVRETGSAARHAVQLVELANVLMGRYELRGDAADFEEALRCGETAVEVAEEGGEAWLLARATVAQALLIRHRDRDDTSTDRFDDLERAVDWLEAAVDGLPADHVNAGVALQNLAAALTARYYEHGALTDLDSAAERLREAYAAVRLHPEQRIRDHEPGLMLGHVLHQRWLRHGAFSDLDEAVAVTRQVVRAVPDGWSDRDGVRVRLVRLLLARYGRTGIRADLTEASRLARQAVRETPGDDLRALNRTRAALADALLTTLPGEPGPTPENTAEAVGLRRQAHTSAPTPETSVGLARALHAHHRATAAGGPPPDEARHLLETALPNERGRRPEALAALGALLGQSPDPSARERAKECFREVALMTDAAPAERLEAAQSWAELLASQAKWEQAAKAYQVALALLPQLAPHTLERTDREHGLGSATGLASDAAACLLRMDRSETAIRLWEAGRGVLWEKQTETRGDLAALRAAAPRLARSYEELRERLDAQDRVGSLTDPSTPYGWQSDLEAQPGTAAEQRRRLGQQWQSLLEEIRSLEAFADFPRLPGERDIPHSGVTGPVVAILTSTYGSCAVVLGPDGAMDRVPLPELTPGMAAEYTDRLNGALKEVVDPQLRHERRRAAEDSIAAVLEWLGAAVTGPVLAALGYGPVAAGEPLPRLWWVPDGALAQLPLHAAGTALQKVCSSYALTLGTLRRASANNAMPPAPRVLAVAMPQTPGAGPIEGAAAEARHLAERYGAQVLAGERATHDVVCAALPDYEVVHFACHSDGSGLLLQDHRTRPLTVFEISRLELPRAKLAYLSACTTSLGPRQLADEAVHLAAAFQQAGFPHVIGTLWSVEDAVAKSLCAEVYDALPSLDTTSAAEALHRATRDLSERYPDSPSLWAAFVHFGP